VPWPNFCPFGVDVEGISLWLVPLVAALPRVSCSRRVDLVLGLRAADKVFRVAYQKGATNLVLLKERGTIEEALKALHWFVTWAEFPAGPQLLEALNVGAADFDPVGDCPPLFAQAAAPISSM
jgi:ABC-type nitrate/sulfonate/bicarbonate transport system substrate-binding protein